MKTLIQIGFSSDDSAADGPITLPGLVIPDGHDSYTLLDYDRYLADEGLRVIVNALYARGVLSTGDAVDENGDGVTFPTFPVGTALERELRERPRVPELGALLVSASAPSEDGIPLGSAVLYFKKIGTAPGELWVKAKGACAVATLDLFGGGTWKAIARQAGNAGNSLRVKVTLNPSPSYSSFVNGDDITFSIPLDSGSLSTMLVEDFVAAVNADANLHSILAAEVGDNSAGEAMTAVPVFTSLSDGGGDVYDALIVFD